MIGLADIEELIGCALYTGYVENVRPLSLLLVSAVESGKTETTVEFALNKGILHLTNFTAYGLTKAYMPQLLSGEIKHLLIPDLIVPLSKSREAVSSTTAFLNAYMEEGVKEVVTYNFPDGLKLPHPVRGGVIAAIATEDFHNRQKAWTQVGFISRFLPVSYSYDLETTDAIFDAIINGETLASDIKLDFPDKPVPVVMPPEIARELKPKARENGLKMGVYGFRPLRHLVRLAKGRALSQGRTTVTSDDKDRVLELARYLNLDHNEILATKRGSCIYNENSLYVEGNRICSKRANAYCLLEGECSYKPENCSYRSNKPKPNIQKHTIHFPAGSPCCKHPTAYCLLAECQPAKECNYEPGNCPHISYPFENKHERR